jgi:hypothetical protein
MPARLPSAFKRFVLKQLTITRRLHFAKHAAYKLQRALAWKRWRVDKRNGFARERVYIFRHGRRERVWAYGKKLLPSIFCLDENPVETLAFLENMRNSLLSEAVEMLAKPRMRRTPSRRVSSYFDFKSLERISPTAALVLAATFDRRKFITKARPHTIDENLWRPEVTSVLRSVGFHELLEMEPQVAGDEEDASLRILKFVSGEKAEGERLGRLQERLVALLPRDEQERLLYAEPYGGMLEAALNSNMWAYPPNHAWDFPVLPRWWITGAIDTRNRTVTVAVYDQGVSIPASLPHWEHWGKVDRMVRRLVARSGLSAAPGDPTYDGEAIRLAMTVASSKTKLPQHGKGLHTMLEVVQRARSGRLRIMSRKGDCIWEKDKKPVLRNYQNSIGGTLIEWRIEL